MQYVVKNKPKFNNPSPQVSARRGHYQGENAKQKEVKFSLKIWDEMLLKCSLKCLHTYNNKKFKLNSVSTLYCTRAPLRWLSLSKKW